MSGILRYFQPLYFYLFVGGCCAGFRETPENYRAALLKRLEGIVPRFRNAWGQLRRVLENLRGRLQAPHIRSFIVRFRANCAGLLKRLEGIVPPF